MGQAAAQRPVLCTLVAQLWQCIHTVGLFCKLALVINVDPGASIGRAAWASPARFWPGHW